MFYLKIVHKKRLVFCFFILFIESNFQHSFYFKNICIKFKNYNNTDQLKKNLLFNSFKREPRLHSTYRHKHYNRKENYPTTNVYN